MSKIDTTKIPVSRIGAVSSIRDYKGLTLIQLDAFPVITDDRIVIELEPNPVIDLDTASPTKVGLLYKDATKLIPASADTSVGVTTMVAGTVKPMDPESPDLIYMDNSASAIGPTAITSSTNVTNVVAGVVTPDNITGVDASGIGPNSVTSTTSVTTVVAGVITPEPLGVTDDGVRLSPEIIGTTTSVSVTNMQ